MTRTRTSPIASYFLSLVCFVLFASQLGAACSNAQRHDTIHASLVSVNAARDGFLAWDRRHQQTIIDRAASREDAKRELGDYRATQTQVTEWFAVVYQALATAATENDEPSLTAAVHAATDIVGKIADLIHLAGGA